jgi:hypothetical protein
MPASEALNRVLLPVVDVLRETPRDDAAAGPLVAMWSGYDDVRGIALRQARDLPPERWNVLNPTLKALLELDDNEADQ